MEALARLSGLNGGDPAAFGAGAQQAEVRYRAETVAYGYPAVVDEYADPVGQTSWCTLTVMLPCSVPTLILDHRSKVGTAGVPAPGVQQPPFGDALFDRQYVVTSGYTESGDTVVRLVNGPLREALLRTPVQRLQFSGSTLLVRTFDGTRAVDEVTEWLERVAAAVLAATPASTSAWGGADRPFPPGLYGPNSDGNSRGAHRPGRRGLREWLTALIDGRD